jgi:hypothetical protein
LLKTGAVAGITLLLPRKSRADVFGQFPSSYAQLQLAEAKRPKNILEIYLYGGLSPWETLYFVDDYGKADNTFYYAFENLPDGVDSNQLALQVCQPNGAHGFEATDFARDYAGTRVKLGPYSWALRQRPDFVERMRLVVQQHNLLPHEAAVPLAISGKRVGTPALAGLGAHVQRFCDDNASATEQRKSPYAYVLASSGAIPSDNTAALVATGTHPGSARPLRINVDAIDVLKQLLARDNLSGVVDRHDALVDLYTQKFGKRLERDGKQLRSPRYKEIAAAAAATRNAGAVKALLEPALLPPPNSDVCGSGQQPNIPQRSLEVAAHLLLDANEPAKYVCVVDTGLTTASGGGGYDTHSEQCVVTARNFTNLMNGLASIVNAPHESDPKKLNLDDTLIILNTEFGRTPTIQADQGGRNHHPPGYVTAFIGGPIQQRAIAGAIDKTGIATSFASPGENRIAALLAMGIFPFSQDGFNVGDCVNVSTEDDAIRRITKTFLGVHS